MQIVLIGCENSETCCETVTCLIEGRGGRALSDCARKLELTCPWAVYQLNSDLSEEKFPKF